MNNLEIRLKIKESRIHHYEVASRIGISENTLCRWLRKNLSEDKKNTILQAISDIICEEKR